MSNKIPLKMILAECDKLFEQGKNSAVGTLLLQWRQKAQEEGEKTAELSLVNELIGHYRMQGDAGKGSAAVNDALELLTAAGCGNSVSAGTILINAATALHSFGQTKRARELFDQAYALYAAQLAPDDLLFAALFNNMAGTYASEGDLPAARACSKEAADILKSHGKIMDLAVTFANLAQFYPPSSPEADEALDKMLDCFNDPAVARDGYYAHTCGKCAGVLSACGRGDAGNDLLNRAKEFYERY